MIACASARAPGKADNSPFPELFALRRIVHVIYLLNLNLFFWIYLKKIILA